MNESKISPRPGIIMTMICGRMCLVPTRKAADEAGISIMQLAVTGAVIWKALSREGKIDIAYRAVAALQRKTLEEVRDTVDRFVSEMAEKGFLIIDEEPETSDE